MKIITFLLTAFIVFASCKTGQEKQVNNINSNAVTVSEVIQAGTYTYLRVDQNGTEKWLAVRKMDAQIGDTYYYEGGMTMKDFESEALNRTFEEVIFLDEISTDPMGTKPSVSNADATAQLKTGSPTSAHADVKIEKAEGGISIAELYNQKKDLNGKKVILKGKVTKFNQAIMNTNWLHLQDGTEANGKYDITIKSDDTFEVGEVVTIEGKVAIDQDFGYGYAYEILIEDAVKK